MTVLRFARIPSDQPCAHQDCRRNPRGQRPACYQVEIGEVRPVTRVLCVNHAAAIVCEHGHPFPPVGEAKS